MGQKINPTGLRIGVIKDWESRWYADPKDFGDTLVEDHKLREFLLELLAPAGVPKIEIERNSKRVNINIFCAKPGMVIGKGGAEIEKLKKLCESKLGGKEVSLNIVEVKQPDLDAQLVAENIASQLERRVSFRRALKQSIGRTMRLGARGIKTQVSGRLGGAEIARTEQYHEGTIRCRPSEPTSTMASLRPRPLTAASVSRSGSTRVRFFMTTAAAITEEDHHARKGELANAVTQES